MLSSLYDTDYTHTKRKRWGEVKIRFEFLPNEEGVTEGYIVDANRIEQINGWIIALKGEAVVFVTNEKYIKFVWLYE